LEPGRMIDYRIDLADRSAAGLGTVILADVLNVTGVVEDSAEPVWTEELNGWGSFEFSLPIDHAQVTTDNFAIGEREIHLYRNDVHVFGGKLWIADVTGWEVRMIAYGWWFDMGRRPLEADYVSSSDGGLTYFDQADIVRQLVNEAQALPEGNLGITHFNTTDHGVTRKLVVCAEEQATVADVVADLAAAKDGFDYWVSPSKELHLDHPERGTATAVAFSDENLGDFSHQRDASELLSIVNAVGTESDCAIPLMYQASDATALTKYGRLVGPVELPETRKVIDQDQLEKIAEEELLVRKDPRFQPNVMIETPLQEVLTTQAVGFDDIGLGDVCAVDIHRGPIGGFGRFQQDFRVVRRTVSIQRPGIERIEFGLDQVVLGR
jgi:hypothetical protein